MKPRRRRCGSARTSLESSTAPHGMPAPARVSMTSCFVRFPVHASIEPSRNGAADACGVVPRPPGGSAAGGKGASSAWARAFR